MQLDSRKIKSEMSSHLSAKLSSESVSWKSVFELQNNGEYAASLAKLSEMKHASVEASLFAEVLALNLRMCLVALTGSFPDEDVANDLRDLISRCLVQGCPRVAIEAAFLLFDCFPAYSDEALMKLSDCESHMDQSSRRRWLHRRGLSHVRSGDLQGAIAFWVGLVGSRNDLDTDQDDSLAALLLDYGRVSSQLGKYSDAVELYNQALCLSKTPINQAISLVRLSNALERISRPAQADKRRIEYFNMIGKEYPTRCALCSMSFGKEPKFLLPCCKTITHSECLRIIVSEQQEDETDCPFCSTHFLISDIADPSSVSARKYHRHKKAADEREYGDVSMDVDQMKTSE